MSADGDRLPGEPPVLRNWQPATTTEDYVRNIGEGLEERSDHRFAKLMGWSRVHLYRARLMAELPDDLFEELLAAGVHSAKGLAQVALALKRGEPFAGEIDRCPHCGGILRRRRWVSAAAAKVVAQWLTRQQVASDFP
jgi:hypothetical protein